MLPGSGAYATRLGAYATFGSPRGSFDPNNCLEMGQHSWKLTRYLILGYWILDTGNWKLETGYWILDTGYWILDTGYWMLDTESWG